MHILGKETVVLSSIIESNWQYSNVQKSDEIWLQYWWRQLICKNLKRKNMTNGTKLRNAERIFAGVSTGAPTIVWIVLANFHAYVHVAASWKLHRIKSESHLPESIL